MSQVVSQVVSRVVSQVVIKVGGGIFEDGQLDPLCADVATLIEGGAQAIVVHGGGPQATALQRALGQIPHVVGGRRITDAAALDVMKMVVAGRLNVDLCAALLAAGARPIGLHGASSMVIRGVRRPPRIVSGCGPDPIDFGQVGDVVGFDEVLLRSLLAAGHVPVLACLAATERGVVLNINADIVANQLAGALGADRLVLVTGTPGVLRERGDPSTRLPRLSCSEARAAIACGVVSEGMIPKLEESLRVLDAGTVKGVHIVGGLGPGDLLAELRAPGSIGTALGDV